MRCSKRSPVICSVKTAPRAWARGCKWNGPRGYAALLAGPNIGARESCSIIGSALMEKEKSIARCATSWPTCSRNFAPVAGASRHMERNGGAPARILASAANRVVTRCRSRFGASRFVTFIFVRTAKGTFHARVW